MITEKELFEETYGTMKLLERLKSGFVVYNKPHFKKNFISITTDINEINQKLKEGWELRPGKYKFILRAPEAVLCDLSEIYPNQTFDLKEIITLFRILKSLNLPDLLNKITSRYFPNLETVLFEGGHSNLEIRIAGSDKRIFKLPRFLYYHLKETNLWKTELKDTKRILKERRPCLRIKTLKNCSLKTQNFYNKIVKQYSNFEKINFPSIAVYGFWKNFPKNLPQNTIYIFVPKAGLKYAFGFIEDKRTFQQIMLWECHLSLDMTKELIIFNKVLRNKKVVIIDRSYSSNTLDYLSEKVIAEGGNPLKIALFPKSKRAIQHSDYFLFLDKFIASNTIQFKKNWPEELFVKVVNNDIVP